MHRESVTLFFFEGRDARADVWLQTYAARTPGRPPQARRQVQDGDGEPQESARQGV